MALGVALAGGGEFAFVLFTLATGAAVDPEAADLLVIVVTVSLMLAPLLIAAADLWHTRFAPPAPPPKFDDIEPEEPRVLIAGFGRFGQIVARVLRARHIRFTALEINQAQVDFVRRFGNKLYYGDASRLEMLRAAGAEHADVLVLAIDDVEASVRTAEMARRHFPKLRVLARARNRQHAFRLLETRRRRDLARDVRIEPGTRRSRAGGARHGPRDGGAAGEALPGARRGDAATTGGRARRRGKADRDRRRRRRASSRNCSRRIHNDDEQAERGRPADTPCARRVATLAWLATGLPARAAPALDEAAAARFAQLALACAHLEYPNKIAHTLQGPADVRAPHELTPAFYGCYDWHSSVHGHWLLARLAKAFPDAPFASQARAALAQSLTATTSRARSSTCALPDARPSSGRMDLRGCWRWRPN